ncbi:MAG: TIGR01777 family oxidoreductase [Cyanobacteria bacterium SZAS TMP-1]|nr:TIGR01777 family oxidoreductase [Cyanobacteria bacterium SZAS TMP-1]
MKVAIAGASGMVGKALTKYLTSKGHEVTALRRNPASKGDDDVFLDVTPQYLSNFDAVINLAGENIAAKRWTEDQKRLIRESRTKTTGFLARALSQTQGKPAVFINASAIGYYGDRGSAVVDEDSTPGTGFLPAVCKDWEDAARAANSDNAPGPRLVLARIGIVISKEGGALNKMLLPFQMGGGGILGSGRQYMSWISIEDIVRAFEFIINDTNIKGPVNLVSPNAVTNAQFTKTLGEVLHRPTILPAPSFALKIILGDMAQEMLLEGCHVKPSKLTAAGFTYKYADLKGAIEHEVK